MSSDSSEFVVLCITASGEEEAVKIAGALVESKLAGCVNIVRDIRSIYRWQGRMEDEREVLMIAKTRSALLDLIITKVKELHSYSVPEVIALPIVGGSADYMGWLGKETER